MHLRIRRERTTGMNRRGGRQLDRLGRRRHAGREPEGGAASRAYPAASPAAGWTRSWPRAPLETARLLPTARPRPGSPSRLAREPVRSCGDQQDAGKAGRQPWRPRPRPRTRPPGALGCSDLGSACAESDEADSGVSSAIVCAEDDPGRVENRHTTAWIHPCKSPGLVRPEEKAEPTRPRSLCTCSLQAGGSACTACTALEGSSRALTPSWEGPRPHPAHLETPRASAHTGRGVRRAGPGHLPCSSCCCALAHVDILENSETLFRPASPSASRNAKESWVMKACANIPHSPVPVHCCSCQHVSQV